MATYDVLRTHQGDKPYKAGDTREANPRDVAHLVARGVLIEKKAARKAKNKAEPAVSNKADVKK